MAGIVLDVDVREKTGTSGARVSRNAEKVPGVLYGGDRGPIPIEMSLNALRKALRSGKFVSHVVTLRHKGEDQPVIPRAIQYHPVSEVPIHFDLYRVEEGSVIDVEVPVKVIGQDQSPGVKKGGAVNIVDHVISLRVPAMNIPEELVVDVSALEIGAVVHLSAIKLPEGARVRERGKDPTVVTITGRMADEAPPADAAAAAPAAAAPAKGGKGGGKK